MKYIKLIVSITWLTYCHQLYPAPTITLFFKNFPAATSVKYAQQLAEKLGHSGKLARRHIEGITHLNLRTGMPVTYAGYLGVPDANGQLSFPRKHETPFVYLVITDKLTPIVMLEQTIHHWELAPDALSAIYTVERKEDKNTELHFWDIKKVDKPKDNIIPLESIVIIAKPHHIYVPIGITITQDSPNLVLPDLYVKRGFNVVGNGLYMLDLTHFFGQVRIQHKKEATRYTKQISG